MVKKCTKAEFEIRAREVHGDKYNYDEFDYISAIKNGIEVIYFTHEKV